ncbi:MAG: alpha/beta fold hydrolase [Oscillospiraceae bacterium]|nr:alpha/beta fold hydrolase [Oscillospiraceae bacterium]
MAIREISFASANGRDTVKGWVYTPIKPPRAIVQLVHGFGEHSRRYLHMISAFQEAGFVVYADDHIGHGKTGFDSGTLGDPGTTGMVDGYEIYLKDERALHDMAVKDYPGLPYFMFGHSWGSMIARGYAAKYGEDIKGLLLCGLVSGLKGCDLTLNDPAFEAAITDGHGGDSGLEWMGKVFVGMTERFADAASPNDWIANDSRVVLDHANDPFNCFDVNIQLLFDLVKLYGYIEDPTWAENVPSSIPVYLISGDLSEQESEQLPEQESELEQVLQELRVREFFFSGTPAATTARASTMWPICWPKAATAPQFAPTAATATRYTTSAQYATRSCRASWTS